MAGSELHGDGHVQNSQLTRQGLNCMEMPMCKTHPAKVSGLCYKSTFINLFLKLPSSSGVRAGERADLTRLAKCHS